MIASTVTRRGMRLLESFSKLVERRKAVKLYLAHKLARFFCCQILHVPARARVLETGRLAEESVEVSRTGIYNLLTKLKRTESIGDLTKRLRWRRLDKEHYKFVDSSWRKIPI